jgi:hypothetical protein
MARGIFTTLTESQILTIRDTAIAAITAGKSLTSYSIAGRSVSKQLVGNPLDLLDECSYALGVINPDDYPLCVNVDEVRVTFAGNESNTAS